MSAAVISLLRAELTKAFTLRSIQATLLAALFVPPALAFASGLNFNPAASATAMFPVESHGFEVAGFGQPLIILLAALITGSEYADGQLRSTLLAIPRRSQLLAAKFLVVAGLAVVVGLVTTSASVLLKHAALGPYGLRPDQFTTGMAWNFMGVAVNYMLMALIAAGVTVLAQSFIVTLVVLVPLVLGLTISVLGIFPILKYLPDLAGIQLLTGYPGIGLLGPIPGALIMAAWAIAAMVGALIVFVRRDAGT